MAGDSLLDSQNALSPPGSPLGPRPGLDPSIARLDQARPRAGGGVRASVSYDDHRQRPVPGTAVVGPGISPFDANRTLGVNLAFDPTPGWSVAWNTVYNLTRHEFGQHVVRLDRDLHRWRATFAFIKAPNGNFAFNFFVSLRDEPDIKFQYDQRTVGK